MEIQQLKKEILQCRECEELFGYEPHPVFFGHSESKIMQISQAPSLLVHKTGKPFNDLSGKKLRQEWYQIEDEVFYNSDYFYITSVAHCYPGKIEREGTAFRPEDVQKSGCPLS
ncbi:MAG: uracil-DNA glycosylase family protein [Muricomes sp.]